MKQTLLIITDDGVFPNLFQILLQRMIPELKIEVCESCKEIDRILFTGNCKLIVVDGKLSEIPTIEVIQHIRLVNNSSVPIWFFPEIQTKLYIDKLYEMGVTRIIKNPFDPYIVTAEIVSLLVKTVLL
ncbi:MAG: hypothetical protein Q8904_08690 [Bacteroidota bacterium]|nr:hypothetical protein [Bacteroidota bacterium]